MTTKTIRDKKNNTIGFIEDHGDQLVGKDKFGSTLGHYDKGQNITVDKKSGRTAEGDNLISLIYAKALDGKIHMQADLSV